MGASPGAPSELYTVCLECGRKASPSVAETCLDRAVEHGRAAGRFGTTGKAAAFEARGDVRVARDDVQGARLDYYKAIGASRSQPASSAHAVLLEKAADASLATDRAGEAFGSLSAALKLIETLQGSGSDEATRLRARVRTIAIRLTY